MKRFKYICVFLIICVISSVTYLVYHYYAPPHLRKPYQLQKNDDTLRIAFIGDSWASMHSHNCLIPEIIQNYNHQDIKIYTYGLSGRTSKEIYEGMYDDPILSKFLQERSYNYCIISAGINDINKKMSTYYYKVSMYGIIQQLLYNNIYPIILDIPDFDVYKVVSWLNTRKKILRKISMIINRTTIDDKQRYRQTLNDLIKERNLGEKVSIIKYESWNNDYSNDLNTLYLSDGLHLNEYGYNVLDSIIAKEISYHINKTIKEQEISKRYN